jgi:peptide/nickel transport system substrate-binding protein
LVFAQQTSEMAAAAKVDRNHTLIWAVPSIPPGLDIYFYSTWQTMEAVRNVYDSALFYPPVADPNSGFVIPDFSKVKGMLAEKWWFSNNNRTFTIKLKEGIISHEGNELVADDFVWERSRCTRLIGVKNWWNEGLMITDPEKQVKKIDKYTFSITTESPNPFMVGMFTHMANHIIDSKAYKAHENQPNDNDGTKWSNTKGSGYGPYKVVDYHAGDSVTFLAHDKYWDKSYPMYFKKVIMKEVPKSSSRMALVLAGDADAALNLTPKELKEMEGKPGVRVMHWKSNIITRIEFQCTRPPFNNPLVRKALCFATPYDEILKSVYLGTANQAKSPVASAYPGFNGSYWQYKLDYDKAKELLAQAGYAKGFDTVMELMVDYPQDEQIAIILKNSFAKVGVNVTIEKLQAGDYWSKGPKKDFKGMFVFSDMSGIVDPAFAVKLWLRTGHYSNFSGYSNAEVDKLYDETCATLNQDLRFKDMDRVQQITVWEDPAWILIAEPGYHVVVRNNIKNLFWQSLQEIRWGMATREE